MMNDDPRRPVVLAHYGVRCNRCGARRDLSIHQRTYRAGLECIGELEPMDWRCHRASGPRGLQGRRHGCSQHRNDMFERVAGRVVHCGHPEWSATRWAAFVDGLEQFPGVSERSRRERTLLLAAAQPRAPGIAIDREPDDVPIHRVLEADPKRCREWVAVRLEGTEPMDFRRFCKEVGV